MKKRAGIIRCQQTEDLCPGRRAAARAQMLRDRGADAVMLACGIFPAPAGAIMLRAIRHKPDYTHHPQAGPQSVLLPGGSSRLAGRISVYRKSSFSRCTCATDASFRAMACRAASGRLRACTGQMDTQRMQRMQRAGSISSGLPMVMAPVGQRMTQRPQAMQTPVVTGVTGMGVH